MVNCCRLSTPKGFLFPVRSTCSRRGKNTVNGKRRGVSAPRRFIPTGSRAVWIFVIVENQHVVDLFTGFNVPAALMQKVRNVNHSSNTTTTILCGACKSPAESISNPQPKDKVTCSRCGAEDSFDNVMRSVKDYIGDRASKRLSDSLRKAVRGSKHVKFESKRTPQRSFRWVTTDLGL